MSDKKINIGDILIDDTPSEFSHTPVFASPEEEDAYVKREMRRIKENAIRNKK